MFKTMSQMKTSNYATTTSTVVDLSSCFKKFKSLNNCFLFRPISASGQNQIGLFAIRF